MTGLGGQQFEHRLRETHWCQGGVWRRQDLVRIPDRQDFWMEVCGTGVFAEWWVGIEPGIAWSQVLGAEVQGSVAGTGAPAAVTVGSSRLPPPSISEMGLLKGPGIEKGTTQVPVGGAKSLFMVH